MRYWLEGPTSRHVDLIGLVLGTSATVAILVGVVWRARAGGRWRSHPFRFLIGHYWGTGAISLGLVTSVAAVSHIGGVPVYGTRIAGAGMLTLVAATVLGAGAAWRFRLASLVRKYEQRHPEILSAGAARAQAIKLETPVWYTVFIGGAAYLAFIWHPWNHVFHEGNIVLGGLAGYAIGSLVGVLRYGVPRPPPASLRPVQRAKQRGRRR